MGRMGSIKLHGQLSLSGSRLLLSPGTILMPLVFLSRYIRMFVAMDVRGSLKGLLGIIMICLFIWQMWELFDQYISEMKTVAVSFREEREMEFPSFAFCDSTAFKKRIGVVANVTLYNLTAINVEVEASMWLTSRFVTENIKNLSFPTIDNGYCTLFELHGKFQVNAVICELKT